MRHRVLVGGLAAALALSGLAACGNDKEPAPASKVDVVAGFYPLQFVAERVGGPHVAVANLAQPGAEPHDMELKPSQIIHIADADLVIYLKHFQPEVDLAVAQNAGDKSLDVATITPLVGQDPHVWLDPTRLAAIGDATAAKLAETDPANAAAYTEAAAALRADLLELDQEFASGLQTCDRREIVTSHAAFGYLARRYQLTQIGLTGLSPEEEPTPKRLTEVAAQAKAAGATTIFFESLVSPRVAQTLADEAGAKTAVLDPIEGLAAGSTEDYFSVMRANLKALREALGCR
ncbi:metal ABC transporter substrate-binding protein [Rhizocola hellebori]|nr:metal ABC transporter substrate-binding protein [Rhizocola hellebori]